MVGQLATNCGQLNRINPYETLGAAVGGALSGYTEALTTANLLELGSEELPADLAGAAVGYTPAVVGGAAGQSIGPSQ